MGKYWEKCGKSGKVIRFEFGGLGQNHLFGPFGQKLLLGNILVKSDCLGLVEIM